jgi:metallopeptidase family M12-like protein
MEERKRTLEIRFCRRGWVTFSSALLLSLLCASIWPAMAKTYDLFAKPDVKMTSLTPRQNTLMETFRARPTTVSVDIVKLNPDALSAGVARLSLAGMPTIIVRPMPNGGTSQDVTPWTNSSEEPQVDAVLAISNGAITGTVASPGHVYQIEPLGNGLHAIIKVDRSRAPPDDLPDTAPPRPHAEVPALPSMPMARQAVTEVRVLVAYTPAAAAQVGDIIATSNLGIAQSNISFANSQVNGTFAIANRPIQIDYVEGAKTTQQILDDFGRNPIILQARTTYLADLVILIENSTDNLCGQAARIYATARQAYAVVKVQCITNNNYTFTHELGHLMGARHDPDHDPTQVPFAFGHGYQYLTPVVANQWRTIMAYDCPQSCTRLLYWSNPNVRYGNPPQPMGTAALNDNARVLNLLMPVVANFAAPGQLIYGKTYNIANGYNRFQSGGFLDTRNPNCQGNVLCVSTATSPRRDGLSGTWKILPADGSVAVGDSVQAEDNVYIQNQYTAERYLDTRERGCNGNDYCVSVANSQRRDGLSGTWKIVLMPLHNGAALQGNDNFVYLVNQYNPSAGYLDTRGHGCQGNLLCVSTTSIPDRDDGSSRWGFNPQ